VKKVLIPGTDIAASRLSFGTASLHHLLRPNQRQTLLGAVVDAGFTHLDTSPYYGYGLAEEAIGLLIKNGSSALTIASKIGLYPPTGSSANSTQVVVRKLVGRVLPRVALPIQDWSLKRAQTSLDKTLRRIHRDYLDILYLHEPVYGCLDEGEFVAWLERQKELGKIRCWGLAGDSNRFGQWLDQEHPLGKLLQVKRSLDDSDLAPAVAARPNQFSYGYLSSAKNDHKNADVLQTLSTALRKNPEGSIIVSTRNPLRIAQLTEVAM
jgi:aryl-alcohol dehydrogenase-like predicted oxidoreductase